MKKREFLKLTSVVGTGILVSPLLACNNEPKPVESVEPAILPNTVFTLPELGYAFNALEHAVDAMTMEIHHDKHHGGYVTKLNAALEESTNFGGMTIEQILAAIGENDTAVRNNGGGHFNHSLFWKVIAPGGANQPSGALAEAINASFGSYDVFAQQFADAAAKRFGSGWAWLSKGTDGKLVVSSTPNQDNPLMSNLAEVKGTPILGLDVWEHAYYLQYQNRRADYISQVMAIVNWDAVAANFAAL